MDKDTIPYHDSIIAVFLLIILHRISTHGPDSIDSNSQPVNRTAPPVGRRLLPGRVGLVLLAACLLLLACTPGDLSRPSTGWSPVAAAPIPQSTGSLISEGGTFSPEDNLLTVTDANPFVVGSILEIGGEQMEVTSISFRNISVARGVNGTVPRAHPDGSEIMLLADDMAIYIGTKQGTVKSLLDDGSGVPSVEWISSPLDPEQ